MAYTTIADVRLVLGGEGTAADLTDTELQYELDAATAEVDVELRAHYVVPFPDPVPPVIAVVTADIAAYRATLIYRKAKDLGGDDPVRLRYRRAGDLVQRLRTGTYELDAPVDANQGEAINPYFGELWTAGSFGLTRKEC